MRLTEPSISSLLSFFERIRSTRFRLSNYAFKRTAE